ncbi:MAG: hypothetical protein HQK96_12985 [Nitrospirae bacterium]|nr:hypothetical protein [Nitrospirota bacterium]
MTNKAKKLSGVEALQFWKGHLEAWQASRITQSQYFRQEGLSLKTFTFVRGNSAYLHQEQFFIL